MKEIYRVTIHGKTLESRNLRNLLAMAVSEKRNMDLRLKIFSKAAGETWGAAKEQAAREFCAVSF